MTIRLKLGVYAMFTVYLLISAGFIIFGVDSILCWIIGLSIVMLSLLAFLYIHGLNTENNWAMLPFLVSELIVRLLVAFVLFISWITYLMSVFDQINVKSPFESITIDQFLLFIAVVISISFVVMVRFYFPLYNQYRDIKKMNDRRRMERGFELEDDSQYMRLHFSARPTEL